MKQRNKIRSEKEWKAKKFKASKIIRKVSK